MSRKFFRGMLILLFGSTVAAAQIPSPALLVLEKDDRSLAIVVPRTSRVVGRVPAGEDPHEAVASGVGRIAYISNYGAFQTPQHTLSIADLTAQQALPAYDLDLLRAPHGLEWANGKVYFTAE